MEFKGKYCWHLMNGRYYLPHGIYCGILDNGAVVLDLNTEKYYSVPSEHIASLQKSVAGWPQSKEIDHEREGDQGYIDSLHRDGFLTSIPANGRVFPAPPVVANESIASVSRSSRGLSIRASYLARFILSFVTVTIYLRRRRLAAFVKRFQVSNRATHNSDSDSYRQLVFDLVAVFRILSLWVYSRHDACLLDSLTLAEFLRRSGVLATFIIGVNSKPFSAHAWVQFDNVVLNDIVENAQDHTVILALPSRAEA